MMAVWVASGALLLVMLIGTSYSHPVKQGFDPSSTYGSSYDAKPASTGSYLEVASSGSASVAPGAGLRSVSNPARPYTATHRKPSYPQPSVKEPAAASYGSTTFAAPVYSGYASSHLAGSTHPSSSQPTFNQDIPWTVGPSSHFSRRPSSHSSVSSIAAPEPLGPVNVSPPVPQYQAGELSQVEEVFEHGNYESEREEQSLQAAPPVAQTLTGRISTSESAPPGLSRSWLGYPYDYMFLTGQYPPGTVTHYSESSEQGEDHWQDDVYTRAYLPASTWEVETSPADFAAPQHVTQPMHPVKQSTGSTSYGQSGVAVSYDWQSGAAGLQGPYSEQPHWLNPAGGYGPSKVGY